MVRSSLFIGALLAGILGIAGCSRPEPTEERTVRIAGEAATISVRSGQTELLRLTADTVRQLNDRLFPLIDIYAPHSEISRANQIASLSRFPISRDTQRILEYSVQLSARLDGAFDPTDAALRHLWDQHFQTQPSDLLPEPLVQATLAGVGIEQLEIREHALSLRSPGTQLNLNDFIRPYLIDLSIIQMRQQGYSDVLISLGNSGRGLGRLDARTPWMKTLHDPADPTRHIGNLILPDGMAYAIKGLPEDYIRIGENTISRAIDPRTGWPATSLAMVITLGPVAADAYALAQVLFLDGPENGMARMTQMPRYHAFYILPGEPLTIVHTEGSDALLRIAPAIHVSLESVSR